jgi:hypothetical protein
MLVSRMALPLPVRANVCGVIGSRRTSILGVIGTVCLLAAAPAAAGVSSVDAYGGQAAVLGKPLPKHPSRSARGGEVSGGSEQGSRSGASGGGSYANPPSSPGRGGASAGRGAGSGSTTGGAVAAGTSGSAVLAGSSSGSLSLSALDVLLIVLVALVLAALAVAIRRLEHPAP